MSDEGVLLSGSRQNPNFWQNYLDDVTKGLDKEIAVSRRPYGADFVGISNFLGLDDPSIQEKYVFTAFQ